MNEDDTIIYPHSHMFSVCMCAYLQHHEDLGGRLYDLVETTDVLMTQVLHGLNLHLHTGQVVLGTAMMLFCLIVSLQHHILYSQFLMFMFPLLGHVSLFHMYCVIVENQSESI